MAKYKVTVQKGDIALTPADAKKVASGLSAKEGLILKSQVHAGGRGKGTLSSGLKGGVQVLNTPEEIEKFAKQMIGYNLKTHQTIGDGLKVNAVLIHEGVDIKRQIYLAFVLDRNTQRPAIVASKYGGMEIEEVAKTHPESIHIIPFEPSTGPTEAQLNNLIKSLELETQANDAKSQIKNLYNLFVKTDSTQLEINPWATNPAGKLYCIDAKINIDDNAKFRQKELVAMRKSSVATELVDPHEEKAIAAGLSYVALDGNIGCMVNGAGLAMATMDIIKLYGAEPANFLDVGGGANVNQVKTAFEILSSHPHVKAILINIFGGILSCETIANGITQAAEIVQLKVPLIVRLNGNSADIGSKVLLEYAKRKNFNIEVAADMAEAAKKAAKCV